MMLHRSFRAVFHAELYTRGQFRSHISCCEVSEGRTATLRRSLFLGIWVHAKSFGQASREGGSTPDHIAGVRERISTCLSGARLHSAT